MRKLDLKTYFAYSWGKYLGSVILIVLFWSWCTDLIIRPRFNERINIFVGLNNSDLSFLNQYKEEYGLKEINIIYHDPEDEMFNLILSSKGIADTDIVILEIDSFNEDDILLWFKEIKSEAIKNYFDGECELYYKNSKAYGIKLKYNVYLFFNKTSPNLGEMNDEHLENDKALLIAGKILKDGENNV